MEDTDYNKVVPLNDDEKIPLKKIEKKEPKKSVFARLGSAVVGNIAGAINFIGKGLFG